MADFGTTEINESVQLRRVNVGGRIRQAEFIVVRVFLLCGPARVQVDESQVDESQVDESQVDARYMLCLTAPFEPSQRGFRTMSGIETGIQAAVLSSFCFAVASVSSRDEEPRIRCRKGRNPGREKAESALLGQSRKTWAATTNVARHKKSPQNAGFFLA